jgi:hypothetical protein
MEELVKKLKQLIETLRLEKGLSDAGSAFPKAKLKVPSIPAIKPPAPPSMTPTKSAAPKIGTGTGPSAKKDPKKVAQQIKDGSMSTKTQKVMLKADSKTGQWYLEPTDPSNV